MTNITRLVPEGASYKAEYQWQTYRFLLSNGNTVDVSAVQDGSWLRDEVLKIANKLDKLPERGGVKITIVGTATLPDPVEEEPKPVKKTPAKRAGRARAEALQESA